MKNDVTTDTHFQEFFTWGINPTSTVESIFECILPESSDCIPTIEFNKVDFPQPLGPKSP